MASSPAYELIREGVLRTSEACFSKLPDYPFQPHYIDITDDALGALRMHYLDEGPANGPVALMLHGNPTWSYLYRHMIGPVAAAGYRVIVPDMIGFGKSDKPASRDAYSLDRFVLWMRKFIEGLGLTGITLVCQDWGGPIGLRVLSEVPERFRAVLATNTLLQNCEPPPSGVANWPGQAIADWIAMCRNSSSIPVDEMVAGSCVTRPAEDVLAAYAAPFPDPALQAGVLQITCCIPVDEDSPGLAGNRAAWRVLEKWDGPFLTAFSDSDPATIGWEAVFQSRIPGAKDQPHTRITNAGHFVQEEQGAALADALIRFLKSSV